MKFMRHRERLSEKTLEEISSDAIVCAAGKKNPQRQGEPKLLALAMLLLTLPVTIGPNLISARKASTNAAGMANLRSISTAIKLFQGSCNQSLPATVGDVANNGATPPTAVTYASGGGGPVCAAVNQAGSGMLGPQWLTGSAWQTAAPFVYAYTVPSVPGGGWTLTAVCSDPTRCSDAYYLDASGTVTHANDGVGATAPTSGSTPL